MKACRYKLTLLLLLSLAATAAFAQAPAGKPAGFKLFFEKVYLHTDRDYYAPGEDIWFKAYLVNGQSNYPTYTSNNLYVELISPESVIVDRKLIRLNDGTGKGDFALPDSLPGGAYRIRAYTNWMKNFGSHFIMEKKIAVARRPGLATTTSGGNNTTARNNTIKNSSSTNNIAFFPESGSLLEAVNNIVAFKATDAGGHGIAAKGIVISSAGDTAARFQSTHLGMGMFVLLPKPGLTYQAKGTYNGKTAFTKDLDPALQRGFTLSATQDNAQLQTTIQTNPATLPSFAEHEFLLAVKHGGKTVFKTTVFIRDLQTHWPIATASLPAGICTITLYDNEGRPNCERLVYIDKKEAAIAITANKTSYGAKEKVMLTITATDEQQQPVKAQLSLAVVDAGIVAAGNTSIASYLLLESELKGYIEEPQRYFDNSNPDRLSQLDLLLRTQGWRDFVWRRIADTSIVIRYMPEPGITISGRIRRTFADRPIPNMNVTLYAPGATGDKFFFTKTDSAGRYYLDGLQLSGSQRIRLSTVDSKGKKEGMLLMDSVVTKPLAVTQWNDATIDTSSQFRQFEKTGLARRDIAKRQRKTDTTQLAEVVVTHMERRVMLRGRSLRAYGDDVPPYDITPADYSYGTLEQYMLQKLPGAHTNPDDVGVVFLADGKPVRPTFIVDKQEDVFERLDYYAIRIDKIERIVYRRMLDIDNKVVFLIYLTLKPGAFDAADLSLLNVTLNGYYESRVFYAPFYNSDADNQGKTDVRTTIYWAPDIVTDASGKATVSFFNADPKTTIRVTAEGLSDKGVPLVNTIKYEVR